MEDYDAVTLDIWDLLEQLFLSKFSFEYSNIYNVIIF